MSRERSLEAPERGYLVSVGGKFTSARADAACIVDRVLGMLDKSPVRSQTNKLPFPWSPGETDYGVWRNIAVSEALRSGLDADTASAAVERLGTCIGDLLTRVETDPALAERVVPDVPFGKAEILHAADNEMARQLQDVQRRLPLLILTRLERSTIEHTAALVAPLLGWSSARCAKEVADVADGWDRP